MKNNLCFILLLFTCFFLYFGCEKSMEPEQDSASIKSKSDFNSNAIDKNTSAELFKDEEMKGKINDQVIGLLKSRVNKQEREASSDKNTMNIEGSSSSYAFQANETSSGFNCYARVYPTAFIDMRKWYIRDKTIEQYTYQGFNYTNEASFTANFNGSAWPISGHTYEVIAEEYYWDDGWVFWSVQTTPDIIFGPPTVPVLDSPSNGSTNQPLTVNCDWNASGTPSGCGDVTYIISYQLQVDNNSNFSSPHLNQSNISATNYLVNNLDYTTTYYWHVRSHNRFGNSNWTSSWNFITETPPPLEAWMTGPDELTTFQTGTWVANYTGGTGTVSYQWWKKDVGSSTWQSIGTGSSVSTTMSDFEGFYIKLRVTRGTEFVEDSRWISNSDYGFDVIITGPGFLNYKEFGTWTANVTNGNPPYSYQWYQKFDDSTYWWEKGTEQTQTLRMGTKGFTVKVIVTDNSSNTCEDTHYVSYGIPPKK